jgi:hypothetical protein
MRISKICAVLGCAIVAVIAYVSCTKWTSQDPQYLAEAFWSDVVPQTAFASAVLLLPAMALQFGGPFGKFAEKASVIYPLLLLATFWLLASTLDGLATPLIFLFFITPAAVFYALLVFIAGRLNNGAKSKHVP